MMMVVTDKKAEIAILKTIGATPRMIRQMFVVQGGLIALVGVSVGGALGVLGALNVGWLSGWVDRTFDLNLFANYSEN
ncbi:FtsX-like permease family protein [Faucicola atlantae]|uniref:FtsX-like permease family protein n=1 Tax=Faucicola atlantae TaxID=34059 RepID=UPI003F50F265